jgi:hypothetical protein
MKPYLLLLTAFAIMISCTDMDDEVTNANIRIKNLSSLTFDEVQVGEQETLHTNIAPEDYSDYLPYETAYSSASISIKAGEETFLLQPPDFVGETELPPGFYTYELNVTEEGGVSLNFKAD